MLIMSNRARSHLRHRSPSTLSLLIRSNVIQLTFPALSNPTINILTSLSLPQNANEAIEPYIRESEIPMVDVKRYICLADVGDQVDVLLVSIRCYEFASLLLGECESTDGLEHLRWRTEGKLLMNVLTKRSEMRMGVKEDLEVYADAQWGNNCRDSKGITRSRQTRPASLYCCSRSWFNLSLTSHMVYNCLFRYACPANLSMLLLLHSTESCLYRTPRTLV